MFDEEIRSEIIKDIRDNFSDFKTGMNDAKLSKMLSFYERFISYPDEHRHFSGYHNVEKVISAYYSTGLDEELLSEAITKFLNFEPFLKKLFYMKDPEQYALLGDNLLMARNLLTQLGIYRKNEDSGYSELVPLDHHFNSDVMENNIRQAYEMRNIEAHTWQDYSRRERGERFANVLSVYVYLCYRFSGVIKNRCSLIQHLHIDLPRICETFKNTYESEIRNGFRYVPMRWIDDSGNDFFDGESKNNSAKKTPVRRIQFSGEAGCGKTTIARHLAYQDALRYLKYIDNPTDTRQIPPVPIYIELKNVGESDVIVDYISRVILKCSESEAMNKLKEGAFTLYLDGVNEMISSRTGKRTFTNSAKLLLACYPEIAAVVTDRDEVDINLRSILTVYRPQKPGIAEIERFIRTVTEGKKNASATCSKISKWLEDKPDRADTFNTPFKICRLIQIAESGKPLSDEEQAFTHAYVTMLLEREVVEKMDFMAEPGRLDEVVRYVSKFLNSADERISRSVYHELCSDAIKSRSLSMDAVDCGNLAIQLGFLRLHPDQTISFSDEMIYHYFRNL